ncbi:MAG: HD domain-containing protein [Methanoregula sp.]|nr:HD domain-containing protein [Methanoregula sp.]
MSKAKVQELKFSDRRVFDNIHGFIRLTDFEWEIIDTPIFQRLRNIRQLGLLDYVFPGALHNRFNHSLGVMYIADRMVVSLQEKGKLDGKKAREIVRTAALLHDIGHYPWSHIIESVVKKDAKRKVPTPIDQINLELATARRSAIIDESLNESPSHRLNVSLYEQRNPTLDFAHHERMAGIILFNNTKLHEILLKKFKENEIKKIAQIIAGVYPGPEKLIIHSELDADRFDYLLRDSNQTGVKYGIFDIDQIIRHIDFFPDLDQREGLSGLVVDKKGQKAVEHYLLSRYFLYSTVIYQKTTTGFHKMAERIYTGLLERGEVKSYSDLIKMFDTKKESDYLSYDDSYIFEKLKSIDDGKILIRALRNQEVRPAFLKELVRKVLYRDPLKRVWEEQALLKKGDSKPHNLLKYVDQTTIDSIIAKSGVPKEWYITSKLSNPITSLSPSILIKDDTIDDEFIEYKIRIHKGKGSLVALAHEDSSLLKYLEKSELHIYGVYTKDDVYQKQILKAMKQYEKKNATTDQ